MTLLLTDDDIRALLPHADVGGALLRAFVEQAGGQAVATSRLTVDVGASDRWLRMGGAALPAGGFMGVKVMNRNPRDGMRYLVLLLSVDTGELAAVIDANELTTARTAGTNALGTHLLARDGAAALGVVGSGHQATALVREVARLRPLDQVVVWSPREGSRRRFADQVAADHGVACRAAAGVEDLVASSDVVVLAYRAGAEPVVHAGLLRPGLHVTGLSSVRPEAREVDVETWERADVVVIDDADSVFQSGDGRAWLGRGHHRDEAPELPLLVAGRVPGRTDPDQVTLFKSAGNTVQDVAAAAALYEAALARGRGTDLGAFPVVKPYA